MALKSWSVELGLRNGQARTSKPDPTETHWMLHVFLLPCPMMCQYMLTCRHQIHTQKKKNTKKTK